MVELKLKVHKQSGKVIESSHQYLTQVMDAIAGEKGLKIDDDGNIIYKDIVIHQYGRYGELYNNNYEDKIEGYTIDRLKKEIENFCKFISDLSLEEEEVALTFCC